MAQKVEFRIPNLSNATPASLTDELGKVKAALGVLKKLEKFYIEAWKARSEGKLEIPGESYIATLSPGERTALDQEKVKAYLEQLGVLKDYMASGETNTLRVEPKFGGKPVSQQELVDILNNVLPQATSPEQPYKG